MSGAQEKSYKRFSAQPDGLINLYEVRRRAVQEGVKQLMADFPFITGGVLAGSLSKGRSGYRSDVDVYIFFDAEKVSKKLGIPIEEILHDVPIQRLIHVVEVVDRTPFERFLSDVEDASTAYIRKHVSMLRMPTRAHIIPEASGKAVIDDALRALDFINKHEKKPVQNSIVALIRLTRLFHLSVTQGVFADREYLLKELKSKGAVGEFIWSKIIQSVARSEQFDKHGDYPNPLQMPLPKHVTYPWSLEKALKKYASRSIKK